MRHDKFARDDASPLHPGNISTWFNLGLFSVISHALPHSEANAAIISHDQFSSFLSRLL
jgi:hypothetical protein